MTERPLVYTKYTWDQMPAKGFYNLDMYLRWPEPPSGSSCFMAHMFGFAEGGGGYIGLQQRHDGRRQAIFSIWDNPLLPGSATPHPNSPRGRRFGHEGNGTMCLMELPWQSSTEYRLRLWAVDQQSDSESWVGRVATATDNTLVGTIRLATVSPEVLGFGWLNRSSVFTEYYGRVNKELGCEQPFNRAVWRGPYANSGAIHPQMAYANYSRSETACLNSHAYGWDYPVVVHEAGEGVVRGNVAGTVLW
jgi:hypothetical protein